MNELANRKVNYVNVIYLEKMWVDFASVFIYSTHVLPKVKVNQTHSNKGLIVFIPIIFIY